MPETVAIHASRANPSALYILGLCKCGQLLHVADAGVSRAAGERSTHTPYAAACCCKGREGLLQESECTFQLRLSDVIVGLISFAAEGVELLFELGRCKAFVEMQLQSR